MSGPVIERRPLGRRPDLETMFQRAIDNVRAKTVTDTTQAVLDQLAAVPESIRTQVKWDVRRALNQDLGVRLVEPSTKAMAPRKSSARVRAEAAFAGRGE